MPKKFPQIIYRLWESISQELFFISDKFKMKPNALQKYRLWKEYKKHGNGSINQNMENVDNPKKMKGKRDMPLNSTPNNTFLNNVQYYDEHAYTVGFRDEIEWDWEGSTYLSGWSINPFTITLPDLLIYTDFSGKVIGTTQCGIARKDIAEAYRNENVLFSGWKITLPKFANEETNQEIKVYAYIETKNSAFLLQNWTHPINNELKQIEEDLWLNASGIHSPDKSVPYYSCKYIEGGIIFTGYHVMQICCIINLNSPDPYDGIYMGETNLQKISVDALLQKRMKVITENQNGGYSACKGCPELRKKMWPVRGDLFNYLNIGNDLSCNLKCKYCVIKTNQSLIGSTPIDEVLHVIKTLESENLLAKNTEVAISGGEPAMMNGLDKLLGYLTKRDFIIQISSNGTIFSQAIYDALKIGKTSIIISVDSVSEDVYLLIKGKDFCRQVWRNIDKYAEVNKDLVIPKIIIMKENMHEMEYFIQRCIKTGVSSVIFDYDQTIEPDVEIINALEQFDRYCHDYGIKGLCFRHLVSDQLCQKE